MASGSAVAQVSSADAVARAVPVAREGTVLSASRWACAVPPMSMAPLHPATVAVELAQSPGAAAATSAVAQVSSPGVIARAMSVAREGTVQLVECELGRARDAFDARVVYGHGPAV